MNKSIFDGIEEKDINKIMKNLDCRIMIYEKNREIVTNIDDEKLIGIILEGSANIEKYDYNGNKTILEKLEKNSLFGDIFLMNNNDISIVSTSDSKILIINYDNLFKNLKNTNLVNNLFNLLLNKIEELNIRIEILSKRSIKDKVLTYFLNLSRNSRNKTFILPFSYTDLADYLSIDRCAMMREIKKLKELGYIKTNGRKIKLIKY